MYFLGYIRQCLKYENKGKKENKQENLSLVFYIYILDSVWSTRIKGKKKIKRKNGLYVFYMYILDNVWSTRIKGKKKKKRGKKVFM